MGVEYGIGGGGDSKVDDGDGNNDDQTHSSHVLVHAKCPEGVKSDGRQLCN